MLDGNYSTGWMTADAQRGHEAFTLDVGASVDTRAAVLSTGSLRPEFPRAIGIDVSVDRLSWNEVWRGPTTAATVAAAVERPAQIDLTLSFPPTRAASCGCAN